MSVITETSSISYLSSTSVVQAQIKVTEKNLQDDVKTPPQIFSSEDTVSLHSGKMIFDTFKQSECISCFGRC